MQTRLRYILLITYDSFEEIFELTKFMKKILEKLASVFFERGIGWRRNLSMLGYYILFVLKNLIYHLFFS